MSRILCFFLGHKWKYYKRWHYAPNLDLPGKKVRTTLRQWKRCLRCSKRVVE